MGDQKSDFNIITVVDPQIDFVRTVKQMDMKLGGDPSKSPVNTF